MRNELADTLTASLKLTTIFWFNATLAALLAGVVDETVGLASTTTVQADAVVEVLRGEGVLEAKSEALLSASMQPPETRATDVVLLGEEAAPAPSK